MRKVIVYTRPDRGVTLCFPQAFCVRQMAAGGYWGPMRRGFLDTQIERGIAEDRRPDAVRRFVYGLAFGGCSEAEALAIIRDRDCGHLGTGHELWSFDDLPRDDWFFDAWTRSHNGGPISIDLRRAKPIQWRKIKLAVEAENGRRAADDLFEVHAPIAPDWGRLRDRVLAAGDEIGLRRVWPKELER